MACPLQCNGSHPVADVTTGHVSTFKETSVDRRSMRSLLPAPTGAVGEHWRSKAGAGRFNGFGFGFGDLCDKGNRGVGRHLRGVSDHVLGSRTSGLVSGARSRIWRENHHYSA